MSAEERGSPLSRIIFLRSFLPGMFLLLTFSLLSGHIILSAIQSSFEDRLRSSQKLFVETISPDLLMGANAAVYSRCQLYKATLPVESMELRDLSGRILCGPWDRSRQGGVSIESPIYFDDSGQEKASVLRVRYDTSILGEAKSKYGLLLAMAIIGLGIIQYVVARVISHNVSAPISDISRLLSSGDVSAILRSDPPRSVILEVEALRASMKVLATRMVEYQKELVAGAQREAIVQMAAQVAHDIRSPLAALESALRDTAQVPEDKRSLLRAASGRIREIAEGLLEKNRAARLAGPDAGNAIPSQLLPLIDSVVEEKRLIVPEKVRLSVAWGDGAYAVFAVVDPGPFKRVLSNLLNNAVEAIDGGGNVRVLLEADAQTGRMTVRDDGKGIPPELVSRLGERGMSWGKAGGSGLGLSHAKAFAEGHGGRLEIDSKVGEGTSASVVLPRSPAPAWFVPEIVVREDSEVIVLDDDPGVHAVWDARFEEIKAGEARIALRHFTGPEELRRWFGARRAGARGALFLFDHELSRTETTGLALSRELGVATKTILVTGRADDPAVISACAAAGVRLIHKSQTPHVPLRRAAGEGSANCVLVDDDELVISVWRLAAQRAGRSLMVFKTAADCLAAATQMDRDTAFYLDSRLGPRERGEDLAQELHARGFTRIYLATGNESAAAASMPWLAGIIGKEPPWG